MSHLQLAAYHDVSPSPSQTDDHHQNAFDLQSDSNAIGRNVVALLRAILNPFPTYEAAQFRYTALEQAFPGGYAHIVVTSRDGPYYLTDN